MPQSGRGPERENKAGRSRVGEVIITSVSDGSTWRGSGFLLDKAEIRDIATLYSRVAFLEESESGCFFMLVAVPGTPEPSMEPWSAGGMIRAARPPARFTETYIRTPVSMPPIPIKQVAREFNKSMRTIKRWIADPSNGLILIKRGFIAGDSYARFKLGREPRE